MYFHCLAFDFDKEHEWRKIQVFVAGDSLSLLLFFETWSKNDVVMSLV